MRIACWITKATNKHSEYVILIAFPRQKWLRERASMLRYTYITCLVLNYYIYPIIIVIIITIIISSFEKGTRKNNLSERMVLK
jgi:quinol-cytochrome oxidoreductase complex cytochrome b subunit